MNTELQQEAKKHAGIPLEKDIDSEERYFNSNCVRFDDFIAGATSKYVEKQKLQFAIDHLKSLEPTDYDVDYSSPGLRYFRNELRTRRIELEQKLKEYETN